MELVRFAGVVGFALLGPFIVSFGSVSVSSCPYHKACWPCFPSPGPFHWDFVPFRVSHFTALVMFTVCAFVVLLCVFGSVLYLGPMHRFRPVLSWVFSTGLHSLVPLPEFLSPVSWSISAGILSRFVTIF